MTKIGRYLAPRMLFTFLSLSCTFCIIGESSPVSSSVIRADVVRKVRYSVWTAESVRTELAHLQEQTGLSLVLIDQAIQVLVLSKRFQAKEITVPEGGEGGQISADGRKIAFVVSRGVGSHLAVSQIDGGGVRDYPNVETSSPEMCWSPDNAKIALRARKLTPQRDLESELASREQQNPALEIVDLRSGATEDIDAKGIATSQCWSSDGKELVYEVDGETRVYEIERHRPRVVGPGRQPTWSPDGKRIAFLDGDRYFTIDPTGRGKGLLFKKFHPSSGLLWSLDSRFVAYVSQSKFFECGFALDVETYCLRVRRLEDSAEWRVSASGAQCNCQWVRSNDLLRASSRSSSPSGRVARKKAS